MKIAIIGTSEWARALATLVAEAEHQPRVGYQDRPMQGFPGSPNLRGIVAESDLVLVATPADEVRSVIRAAQAGPMDRVIIATKGLEPTTGRWLSDVVMEESSCVRVGAMAGPALAAEVLRGRPTALVVASRYDEVALAGQRAFHSRLCRAYRSNDLRGVELAGVMVGALAMAIGIADALSLGLGMHGVIVTRGIAEAQRLGAALGAEEATFSGLAGVGDLLSCASHPDNPWYRAGRAAGMEEDVDMAMGLATLALVELAEGHGAELPITKMVAMAASGQVEAAIAIDALMRREATTE